MKKAIALLLALVMCFALCACGGSSAPAAPAAQPSSGSSEPAKSDAPAAPAEAPKDDTVYNLIVVNHDATTSMCELYIETLCGMMTEASGGRLQFTFYPGGSLLGATETMDGVKVSPPFLSFRLTAAVFR